MKKIKILFLTVVLLCTTLTITSTSQEENSISQMINQQNPNQNIYSFDLSLSIDPFDINRNVNEDILNIEKFGVIQNPGLPKLPVRIFTIAIPPDAIPISLNYEITETKILENTFNILPASTPNFENDEYSSIYPSEIYSKNYNEFYKSNNKFPKNIVTYERSGAYRSYNLVDIKVIPFSYMPTTGKLSFHSEILINIEYQINEPLNININRETKNIEQNAEEIIMNYEQTKQWYQEKSTSNQGLYDYVIITLDSLTDTVEPLVSWEEEKGRTVKVETISWIDSNYEGYDLAEKIRNFLREKFPLDEWGIEYLCIIGHWDDIPMRKTSQKMGFQEEGCAETDFYYAELSLPDSESWDMDGDHKYGENSDSIDFFGEINVGRIPWSDPETVQHICEKSISYEKNSDPSFKNNILLLSNFIDENTDGATFMEYCVNEEIHPWMSSWMKTRMYERDSTYDYDYIINNRNVRDVWSEGKFGIVSWHSHGNPFGSGNFISVDDCQYLNDDYPSIVSGASCSNSDTDYLNIGQAMMKQGAIGFLGANKATPYQTEWDDVNDGSDQSFKYFFISSITSGEFTQGAAHQYAIKEMYSRGLWDALKYETFVHGSLFGNPDIGISSNLENNPPMKPETPNGSSSGKTRKELSYSTVTTDPDNDDVYYCFSWGDGDIEWVGPYNSGQQISISHKWIEQGNYEIKVKTKDIFGAESEWSDPLVISMPKGFKIDKIYNIFYELFPILKYLFFNLVVFN